MLLPVQSSWEQVRLCEWVSMCVFKREQEREIAHTHSVCVALWACLNAREDVHMLCSIALSYSFEKGFVTDWPCSMGDRHWVSMIFQSPPSTALGLQICEVKDVGTLSQVFMLGQKVILSTKDSFSSGYFLLFFFTWKVNTFQRN